MRVEIPKTAVDILTTLMTSRAHMELATAPLVYSVFVQALWSLERRLKTIVV
jgi:hypothetical protein